MMMHAENIAGKNFVSPWTTLTTQCCLHPARSQTGMSGFASEKHFHQALPMDFYRRPPSPK